MSTVIAWFGSLSFDKQKDALDRMHAEHDQSRAAKRAELVTELRLWVTLLRRSVVVLGPIQMVVMVGKAAGAK